MKFRLCRQVQSGRAYRGDSPQLCFGREKSRIGRDQSCHCHVRNRCHRESVLFADQRSYYPRDFSASICAKCYLWVPARIFRIPQMAAPCCKWLWTVGVGWIALRAILLLPAEHTSVLFPAEHKSIWSALSGSGCTDAASCTNALVLTVLALRIATYSAGANLCSRLQHSGPSEIVDAWFGRFRPLNVERASDRSGGEQDR